MSLIIATGTNLGDKLNNLHKALHFLQKHFILIKKSQIYCSEAVDYLDQPDFFNQVLEFEIPSQLSPLEILKICSQIEKEMGRKRDIPKGPRVIDIDILFFQLESFHSQNLQIPHPRLFERSFVVRPLIELSFF